MSRMRADVKPEEDVTPEREDAFFGSLEKIEALVRVVPAGHRHPELEAYIMQNGTTPSERAWMRGFAEGVNAERLERRQSERRSHGR